MNYSMTPQPGPAGLTVAAAGSLANGLAGVAAFDDYRARRSVNTNRRQAADLQAFADYLQALGLDFAGDLANDPQAWKGITWGLVEGFRRWLLGEGYAVGSVNVRLTTIKVYAALAARSGVLPADELTMIRAVHGFKRSEGKHVDELREGQGLATRRVVRRGLATQAGEPVRAGKKAEPVTMTREQAQALKDQPDTAQGRRDALIMALLLDHGLRVGEVARLVVGDFNLKAGELHFYRPKVDKMQTHKLTADTLRAARSYLVNDAPAIGPIWRGSRKGRGGLQAPGMTARAITERVRTLGAAAGLVGLSAHDCRHYWATCAARNGTPLDRLQDAGGWASLAMPARYIEAAKIANDGVRLD